MKLKDLKQSIVNSSAGILGTILFMIIALLLGNLVYTAGYEQKLCSEKLGVEFSIWDKPTVWYEDIDETRYNCCWNEFKLTEDGYYTKKRCGGFTR